METKSAIICRSIVCQIPIWTHNMKVFIKIVLNVLNLNFNILSLVFLLGANESHTFSRYEVSSELSEIICSNESEPQSINVENNSEQLQSPQPDNEICYKDGNCDEFSDQQFDTDYYEHNENEKHSIHVHNEL